MNERAEPEGRVAIGAPSPLLSVLETRALAERAQLSALTPLLRRLPRGDGHPVIVFPGFTASDGSTRPLRRLLRDLDYRTYGWAAGTNVGPTPETLGRLVERLDRAHSREGRRVSLIGWSLGGIYARELARAFPDRIRLVITLGSPIQMVEQDRSGAERIWAALRHLHAPGFVRTVREADRPRLIVPATSIYSKTDGVVNWSATLIRRTDRSENIRVFGSHCGLGFNAAAIYAIADRLGLPDDQWTHFRAPWWIRGWFPPATDLDRERLPGSAA